MKRFSVRQLAVVCGLLAASLTAVTAQGFPPSPVIVAEIEQRAIVDQVELIGTVHARRTSLVAAESEGKVAARFKEPGQRLQHGEPILRLTNDVLQARLQEAEADVRLQTSRRDHTRQLRDSDAISEDAAIETEYEYSRAMAALEDVQQRLDDLTVRAPFDGALVESLVEIGEWVDRGQSVAHTVANDTVRVYVDVPERYVDRLRLGDPAAVSIAALGGDSLDARVVAILDQGFVDSRSFPVIVEFLNPGRRARGGMSATVRVGLAQAEEDLLVHKDAVITGAFGTHLFVAVDGKATMRPVTTGLSLQSQVAVRGDSLQPGDLAIVRGNERLRDGQDIRVVRKLQQ